MTKIKYKFIVYNAKTNELGVPVRVNGMMLVDIGLGYGYKVLTDAWQEIGFL